MVVVYQSNSNFSFKSLCKVVWKVVSNIVCFNYAFK